jgi:hypothetical protein
MRQSEKTKLFLLFFRLSASSLNRLHIAIKHYIPTQERFYVP